MHTDVHTASASRAFSAWEVLGKLYASSRRLGSVEAGTMFQQPAKARRRYFVDEGVYLQRIGPARKGQWDQAVKNSISRSVTTLASASSIRSAPGRGASATGLLSAA